MALLGPLNPGPQQAQQRQLATQQEVENALQVARSLQKEGTEFTPLASPWQAAARVAAALGGNLQMNRAAGMIRQGQESGAEALSKIYAPYLGGDNATGGTPTPTGTPTPSGGTPTASAVGSPEDVAALTKTAGELGIDPHTFAAAIHYESGFNPNAVGDSGKGYPVKGLIGFDPENVKKYGEPAPTIAGQMPQIKQYLLDRGWKPGVYSPTDLPRLYSIINAGSLDAQGNPRLNAADINGTVGQHVDRIARGSYDPASKFLSSQGGSQAGAGPGSIPQNVTNTIGALANGSPLSLALTGPNTQSPAIRAIANALSPGVTSGTPAPRPDERPLSPGPAPQAGTQDAGLTPTPASGPPSVGQPQRMAQAQPQPGGGLPSPLTAPVGQLSQQDLMRMLANPWVPDGTKNSVLQMIQARASPQTMDVEGGKLMYDAAGRKVFIPEPKFSKMKVGDTEMDVVSHYDPQTRQWSTQPMTPGAGGGSAQPGQTGTTGGNPAPSLMSQSGVPPFPTSGKIEDINAWNATAAANKKRLEGQAEQQVKQYGNVHTGLSGSAMNWTDSLPMLNAASNILENADKNGFYSGTGADAILMLKRAGVATGLLPKTAATPMEAFNKVMAAMLLQQTNNLRAASTEMGQAGGRIFSQQIPIMEKAQASYENTVEGNRYLVDLYKWNANRSIALAHDANAYVKQHGALDADWEDKLLNKLSDPKSGLSTPPSPPFQSGEDLSKIPPHPQFGPATRSKDIGGKTYYGTDKPGQVWTQ